MAAADGRTATAVKDLAGVRGQGSGVREEAAGRSSLTPDPRSPIPFSAGSVAERLFREGFAFSFFQAVRLLEKIHPQRRPVRFAGTRRRGHF